MTDAALEARRAYKREWARKNPDKIAAQQERFYKRLAEKMRSEAAAGKDRARELAEKDLEAAENGEA